MSEPVESLGTNYTTVIRNTWGWDEEEFRKNQERREKDCLANGGHYDNGGFMYGFCKKCGAFLG